MMKESNPPFAPFEPDGLRDEQSSLFGARQNCGEDVLLSAGSDHQRDARARDDLRGLNFRGHATYGRGAIRSTG